MRSGTVARIGAVDVLLTVALAAATVLGALLLPAYWFDGLDGKRADWFGIVLLLASAAPVLVRRVWPVAALLACVPPQVVYHAMEYPHEVGLLIAVPLIYTVAVGTSRAAVLTVVAITSLALLLTVGLTQDGPPGPEVVTPLGWFLAAAIAGQAVRSHRAYLAATTERRVAEERLRIARDLHDVLAHHIVVINSHAAVAAHLLDERTTDAGAAPEDKEDEGLTQLAGSLHTIADASSGALSELRTTLDVLRGNEDTDRQPTPGLDRLADLAETTGAAGVTVTVDVRGSRRTLAPAVEVSLYRIAQEALTNVVKHAGANRARVVLDYGEAEVRLEVVDDGRGAPDAVQRPGYGILGMTERAHTLGGRLDTGTGPDGGFRVVATIPGGDA